MKKFTYAINQEVFSQYDFDELNRLMFDTAKGEVEGVSLRDANAKIREIHSQVLGLGEKATRKEIRKALRRHKNELFEVLEDFLDEIRIGGWSDNAFFRDYVEFKSANYGDTNVWTTPDTTILTVSEVSGGHHDIIRQRLGAGKTFSLKTQWYAVKVYAEYEKFLAGDVDWAKFVQKIYEAMDHKINTMLYTAFMSADSVIPAQTQFVKSGTLTAATMITLVEDVQAANPGKEVVIFGSKSALSKLNTITDVQWISETMKDERHTLGRLGLWEGTRIVEIPQVFELNNTANKLIPANVLLVMPVDSENKMIKVFDEGEAMIKEISDGTTNMDMTMEYEYQVKMGIGVTFMKYFGKYTFTG